MKTCDEIRRENLLLLIEEAGGTAALAEIYGCTEPAIKTMVKAYKDSKSGTPKGIGTASARKLEGCMNKERGWLDHDHSDFGLEQFRKLDPTIRAALMRKGNGDDEQKPDGNHERSPRRSAK